MIAGLINQKIDIVKFEDTDDGAGSSYPVEVSYWETSAVVKPMKARRTLQANQEELKPAFMFEVRIRDDKFLKVDMQVKWRGQYFAIQSAEPDYVYKNNIVIIGRAIQLPVR
jgi:SPP1 family predicted phage head-tail adaptor